jgi:hypothetical protein
MLDVNDVLDGIIPYFSCDWINIERFSAVDKGILLVSLFQIVKQICLIVNFLINWRSIDLIELLLIVANFKLRQSLQIAERLLVSTQLMWLFG